MPKRAVDQLSMFDGPICSTSMTETPIDMRAVIRQEQDRDNLAWMTTCQQCLSGGHDCGMPFCRCQTCGGGFKRGEG